MFLKNRNIISKIRRSKVKDGAALSCKRILQRVNGFMNFLNGFDDSYWSDASIFHNFSGSRVFKTHNSLASILWDIDKQCRNRSDAT